jgi:two-component system, NtrC family, sensor histidine kinase HydH
LSDALMKILQLVNFFFLAFALLAVYYYAYRLRLELKLSDALRKESEQFRDLFNATTEGVFQFDPEGRFTIINRAGARLLGFASPADLLSAGVNVRAVVEDERDRARIIALMNKDGRVQNHFVRGSVPGGEVLYVSLTLHEKKKKDGTFAGYEGIFHDVTQRVALEEELWNYSDNLEKAVQQKTEEILNLERRKLQLEKLAAVGQTMAALTHELRNPLSSIKMGVATLLNRAKLEGPDRRILELAGLEGQRLERLLKDVLDFARPQELQLIGQDLRLILERAADQLEFQFQEKGVVLDRDYLRDLPLVPIDSERMLQVLQNLLLNALQAVHRPGGRVGLGCSLLPDGETLRIEVTDNGEGIREEDLAKVFDPFFSRKSGGTGLGLTVVQKIVEAHRGCIRITSRPTAGTAVHVELPVDRGTHRGS